MIDAGEYVKKLNGKPVAVFGLGLSGNAAVAALVKAGAKVAAFDDRAAACKTARKAGAKIKPLIDEDLSGHAALILAPGVPLNYPKPHPVVEAARKAGLEIFCDIELLHRCGHGRATVGVTGTNGKSTTTALIHHILKSCGRKSALGGNIGCPAMEMKLPPKGGILVLELSSFQLDLCPAFTPDIAVLLNITPDHLDRHGGLEGYIASKERIFGGEGTGIIGIDDDNALKMFERQKKDGKRRMIPVSNTKTPEGGVYVRDNILFDHIGADRLEVGSLQGITTLHGVHNKQNAAAAYAAVRVLGLEPQDILEAARTYPGLPHRQFPVRVINGVAYINDSKATNAEAAEKALMCHNNIYWILGGRPKEGGLKGLEAYMDKVRHAFLIGEAAEAFGSWLDKYGVPHNFSGTLDVALFEAHRMAQAGRGQPGGAGVVLLSPACASHDQYTSFEERGDHFTTLVNALDDDH